MELRSEIVKGKRRVVFRRHASGIDKRREAIEKLMPQLEFTNNKDKH